MPCVHADDWRDPRYVGDAVIRTYRHLGLTRLLADLSWPAETTAVHISGGIGSLLLRVGAEPQWLPVIAPMPSAVPITPEQAARRITACRSCSSYRADSDRCGMCGCAFVIAERVISPVARCLGGRW